MSTTFPTAATLQKAVSWIRFYEFRFAKFAEFTGTAAETITGTPTVTAIPAGLPLGTPSISGSTVLVLVTSGTAGVTYTLTCTITTSGGATLSQQGLLEVLA